MGVIADLLVKIGVDTAGFESGIQRAQSSSNALLAGVTMLGAGFVALGTASVVNAGKLEQTRVAFTTMLGSAEKANTLLKDMQTFAATTPFELTEIQDAGKKLIAFGVDGQDVIGTMRMLGDVSSGVGAPIGEIAEIYGKAKTAGRLFAEDINQLTGRGIPIIKELAKQFNVSESEVKNLVEAGKIGFPELQTAFQGMTAEGSQFGGMMANQSGTLLGMWSNLMDGIGQASMAVGDELIKAFNLKEVIGGAVSALGEFVKILQEKGLATAIREAFPPEAAIAIGMIAGALTIALIPALIGVVTSLLPILPFLAVGAALGALGAVIYQNWNTIGPMFEGAGQSMAPFIEQFGKMKAQIEVAAFVIQEKIKEMAPAIQGALGPIGDAFKSLWENIQPVLLYIGDVIITKVIPAVMSLATAFLDNLPAIIQFFTPLFQFVSSALSLIANFVGFVVALFTGDWATAWQFAGSMAQNFADMLGAVVQWVCNWVVLLFGGMFEGIAGFFGGIGQWFTDRFTEAYNGVTGAWAGFSQWNADLKAGQETTWANTSQWFGDKFTEAYNWVTAVMVKLGPFFQMVYDWLIQIFTPVAMWLNAKFQEAWNFVTGIWGAAYGWFSGIAQGIGDAFNGVSGWITSKFEEGVAWVSGLPDRFLQIGVDAFNGFVQGLRNALGGVLAGVGDLAQAVMDKFRAMFNSHSDSKEMIDLGYDVAHGLITGIQGVDILGFINNMVKDALDKFGDLTGVGKLLWPTASTSITSPFGSRDAPTAGASSYHGGVDIGAGYGEWVSAVGGGRVTQAGDMGTGYGNSVQLDLGNGLSALFGHLSSINVAAGQIVKAGDLLGQVGSTGISTGAHLHYSLYKDGVAVDPMTETSGGVDPALVEILKMIANALANGIPISVDGRDFGRLINDLGGGGGGW